MEKKTKRIMAMTACIVAAATMVAANGATAAQATTEEVVDKNIYVDVQTPVRGDIVITGEFVGTVEPSQSVTVLPKIGGEVISVYFSAGDTVQEGDILCELDSTQLASTVAQTQLALSKAQKQVNLNYELAQDSLNNYRENLENGTNADLLRAEGTVLQAENGVEQASVGLRSARRQWRDFVNDDIYPPSMIALQGVADEDQIKAQLRDSVAMAEAQLEAAQLGLEQAEEGLRAARKALTDGDAMTEKNVKLAEISTDLSDQYKALEMLQKNLSDTKIKAPISGVIEMRNVDPLDLVSMQSPICIISNKDALTVSFSVPEYSLEHLDVGDEIRVEKNGQTCTGTISEIATMVGQRGMFDVKATVINPPFDLRTGSSVKVYAQSRKALSKIILPLDCLFYDAGAPYVYIYENGAAVKRMVQIGLANDKNAEITSGLSIWDEVICTWNAKLADGVQVFLPGETPAEAGLQTEPESAPEESGKSRGSSEFATNSDFTATDADEVTEAEGGDVSEEEKGA